MSNDRLHRPVPPNWCVLITHGKRTDSSEKPQERTSFRWRRNVEAGSFQGRHPETARDGTDPPKGTKTLWESPDKGRSALIPMSAARGKVGPIVRVGWSSLSYGSEKNTIQRLVQGRRQSSAWKRKGTNKRPTDTPPSQMVDQANTSTRPRWTSTARSPGIRRAKRRGIQKWSLPRFDDREALKRRNDKCDDWTRDRSR